MKLRLHQHGDGAALGGGSGALASARRWCGISTAMARRYGGGACISTVMARRSARGFRAGLSTAVVLASARRWCGARYGGGTLASARRWRGARRGGGALASARRWRGARRAGISTDRALASARLWRAGISTAMARRLAVASSVVVEGPARQLDHAYVLLSSPGESELLDLGLAMCWVPCPCSTRQPDRSRRSLPVRGAAVSRR